MIGGALLNLLGWRAIFWSMLLVRRRRVRLGCAQPSRNAARGPAPAAAPARAVEELSGRCCCRLDFLLLAAIPALNFAGFFIYIASAPAFLAALGVTTWGFAWLFVPMIAGVMARRDDLRPRRRPVFGARTIGIGYACMFAGAIIETAVAALVPPSVPWHVLPVAVFTLGSSLLMPSLTLILLDLFAMRGLVSSLQGFVQFAFSGFIAGTIAPLLSRYAGRAGGRHAELYHAELCTVARLPPARARSASR